MPIQSCNAVMGKHLVLGSLSGELKVANGAYWAAGEDLDAALAGLVSGLAAEEAARAAAVSAEATSRSAADGAATTDRAAIRTEFAAADAAQNSAAAAESTARQAAEAAIQADVNQNEADGDADRAAIRVEFAAADTAQNNAAAAESTARQNAEAAIQSDVDQNEADADAAIAAETAARIAAVAGQEARIDAILSGSSASLDQFVEVVAAYTAADGNLQTSITNLSTAAAADRGAIRTEFAAADVQVKADLRGAVSASHNTLKKIEDLMDAEVAARIADVNTEEARALAAEAALSAAAAAESTARQNAEAAIQADVNQNEADGDTDRALIRSQFASADALTDARLGAVAGFSVVNTAGTYSMGWGVGKPKMELTLDGSGGVDVCFSVA